MNADEKGDWLKYTGGFYDCESVVEEGRTLRGLKSGHVEPIDDPRTRKFELRHRNHYAPILNRTELCRCPRHRPGGA